MDLAEDSMTVPSSSFGAYEVLGTIGRGSFGLVLKARKLITREVVALKRIPFRKDQRSELQVVREMFTLRNTDHENIVKLLDVLYDPEAVSLVMELAESNLKTVIDDSRYPLNDGTIRGYFYQILCGVAYLHSLNIMHRDLKPGNILIFADGVLKITDFGQSCIFFQDDPTRSYENQVASRWYRAPELLFGAVHYTPKVDIWSCGCILAELYNRRPLFPGKNDFEQISLIISLLGSPCEDNWKGWHDLPDSNKLIFNEIDAQYDWRKFVPLATAKALSMLQRLIVFDSELRASASAALSHEFFAEVAPVHISCFLPACSSLQFFPTVVEYNPNNNSKRNVCQFFNV